MVLDNNIPPEMCNEIIRRFENDQRKSPGQTGAVYTPEVKTSVDLMISRYTEWEDIENYLSRKLQENLYKYDEFLSSKLPFYMSHSKTKHSGFQIQKSGFYKWHQDSRNDHGRERMLTFIWYLNTIPPENGGETGFLHRKVQPVTGRFVFFPATWDYAHCGFETKDKYIVTGWTHREYAAPPNYIRDK